MILLFRVQYKTKLYKPLRNFIIIEEPFSHNQDYNVMNDKKNYKTILIFGPSPIEST
jgi:hypothetical protein